MDVGNKNRPGEPQTNAHHAHAESPFVDPLYGGVFAMTANILLTPGTDEARFAVADALRHYPGVTARKLAGQASLPLPVVTEALQHMETAGTATRTPDPTKGNRKSADTWEPATPAEVTPDTADETPSADDATTGDEPTPTADDTPATGSTTPDTADETTPDDDTSTDEATGTADAEATTDTTPDPINEPTGTDDPTATTDEPTTDDAPATTDGPTTDDAPTTDEAADTTDEASLPEAPVSGAPVAVRQPDLKVLIMAGVLGGHPDGITADAAIGESGLSVAMGDTILAAMEVAGAARRLPVDDDGNELWVIADGDLATVDPANAPTHDVPHLRAHPQDPPPLRSPRHRHRPYGR